MWGLAVRCSPYFPRCHPAYLSEEAHKILSQPGAFDGLRVHTDEFVEVLARIKPETVTVAVVRPLAFPPSHTHAR